MRKLFVIYCLFISFSSFSQETLSPLGCNPRLYYPALKAHRISPVNRTKDDVIVEYGTNLVETDTLSLPFIDDFSYNTLKPYDYSSYILDTIYNALGPCDGSLYVNTVSDTFTFNQTYVYSFDTALHQLDSTPNPPLVFHFYAGISGACYDTLTDSLLVYPVGYIYVFDTFNGLLLDQYLDTTQGFAVITYAPMLIRSKLPLYTKWVDNNAYFNYTSAYLPPSIGVAKLDGLDQNGQPYNNSDITNWGQADVLTSKPIDMSGISATDTTVYLSFFYQAGGFGDDPGPGDSLCVEIYNYYTNNWDRVWRMTGDTVQPDTPDAFRQAMINIPVTVIPVNDYFYNGFQFRFLNYGSLTGDNDIWNIDYVQLFAGRHFTDTAIGDIAFQYEYPSILQNFTQMPAWQFTGLADLMDTVQLAVANLDPAQATNNPPATQYNLLANEVYPTPMSLFTSGNIFNAGLENYTLLFPSTQYAAPVGGPFDSLVITSQAALDVANSLYLNDTISGTQTLTNTLAYDDGTAELAFGVQNLGTLKFAYDFNLNYPDTVVGFQVMFAYVDVIISDLVFTWNIWDTLQMNNVFYVDSPVYTSLFQLPHYIDSVNGFTTYTIPPMPVPTHFYFGWTQTDTRNLQIGFDRNSPKGTNHMFIYASGAWDPSTLGVSGSPMIRMLMKHNSQIPSAVSRVAVNPVKVYPNPTRGSLTFDLPESTDEYTVELYSALGQSALRQTISSNVDNIYISRLPPGIYMLRLTDTRSGITYQNKIIRSADE